MSIQSEITRITNNVQDTIDVIEQTGVSIPAGANSDNLPSLAQALANEKQDKLTGSQGQFVGFTADNVVGAMDAPSGLPSGGTPGQMLYQGESGAEWGDKPVMYVNVTQDSSSASGYVADKSVIEIFLAVQDGYSVFANIENRIVPLASIQSGSALFSVVISGYQTYALISTIGVIQVIEDGSIPSYTIGFTPGTTGLTATNVQDAIEEVNEKIPTKPIYRTVTLTAAGWSSNTQTVTVQGVKTSGQSVRISPATKTDADNWVAAGVWCSEPTTANQLVFTCDTAPTENININVELQEVQS